MQEKQKLDLLINNGYKYHFERELYFNREKKKIFSSNAIDDHDINWLRLKIEENNEDLAIYFNSIPSSEIVIELKRLFAL